MVEPTMVLGHPSSRASGVGSRVWSLTLQQVGFPSPQVRVEERGKASSRSRSIPGVLVVVMVRLVTFLLQLGACRIKVVPGPAVQIDQLIGLLTGLGCSAAVLGEVQEAVKAKTKPRVVPAAEHTVFVLNDKWDRAEAHRKFLQENAVKKAYWKARKELDKTAASCASASVGERESVNSDDGLANVGLDDEEMEQLIPECMLDTLEAPPAKRVKAKSSSSKFTRDHHVPRTSAFPYHFLKCHCHFLQ